MTISSVDHVSVKRMYRDFQKETNTNYQEKLRQHSLFMPSVQTTIPTAGRIQWKRWSKMAPTLEDIINYTTPSLEAKPTDLSFNVLAPVAMGDGTGP